ncbi:MAG: Dna2/Cas4 domain-containing protein [Methanomicrobiales archaeon]|nr:Dna2/Cas4 domain-containing protein [Methanomicrobiales archaeon]NYT21109.1 Dna2/Cas4 domain-containing protein [Methanomicrobiales archaeon]
MSSIPDLSISGVVTTSICPVRFHLEKGTGRTESWRYTAAKQISYRLGDPLDAEEIWAEVRLLQKDVDSSAFTDFAGSVRLCGSTTGWRRYREADVAVRSETHRIHGIVDKVFFDEPFFAVTRPTPAPTRGVYHADRLRVAGYAICLEEMLGIEIAGGMVEYIHSGIGRVCTLEPIDKRRFFRALQEARRITKGELPKKPLRPPCGTCPHGDRCDPTGGTRLSDLL